MCAHGLQERGLIQMLQSKRSKLRSHVGLYHVLLVMGSCATVIVTVLSGALAQEAEAQSTTESRMAPLPKTVPAPKGNPTTPEKVTLGKLLFFDLRLSGDNKMSCSTCHRPDKAFGDGLFELRRDQVRLFYMFEPGQIIRLLGGMVKKQDRIPGNVLAQMRRRHADARERLKKAKTEKKRR